MAIGIVLDRAADEASVEVPDEQMDLVFDSFLDAQFGGDRQAFLDALGNVGTSEVDVLDEIRRQLRLRMLLDEVDGEVEIGGDELAAAFQERKAQLATPKGGAGDQGPSFMATRRCETRYADSSTRAPTSPRWRAG